MATKQKPCPRPDAKAGKHAWTFVKNTRTGTIMTGVHGTSASLRVVGLYKCECGARRAGRVNINAPGCSL